MLDDLLDAIKGCGGIVIIFVIVIPVLSHCSM
jgi:hypothetical protein